MKKVLSVVLCMILMISVFAVVPVSVSADEVDVSSAGEDTISFDVMSAGWYNFSTVYCHIWACDGTGNWPSWHSKAEKCEYNEFTGIATYDLSKLGETIGSGANWACIFSNDNGAMTYSLLLGCECIGDTAYCDGMVYEDPEDSGKTNQTAFWMNQDSEIFGPELTVTSIGNVTGMCCPAGIDKNGLMVRFLKNYLENARFYGGKDDQTLLDDTGKGLGLTVDDVENDIKEAGVVTKWDKNKSSLPEGWIKTGKGSVRSAEDSNKLPVIINYEYYASGDKNNSLPKMLSYSISLYAEESVEGDIVQTPLYDKPVTVYVDGYYYTDLNPFHYFEEPLPPLEPIFREDGISEVVIHFEGDNDLNSADAVIRFGDAPKYKKGDADGDGEITVTDATRIQQYLANLIDESRINIEAAKTTDDDLSVIDATRIQQHLAKLINLEA